MNGRSVVVGVGSIGREIARLLKRMDFVVTGVGRSARGADPDFGDIHGVSDLNSCLSQADYVVLITPLTPETHGLFGAEQFSAMKSSARFIHLGRGELVDEDALLEALQGGQIAGAGLDVFCTEPLPPESPFWDLDNVIVSPHISGDYQGHQEAMAEIFLKNSSGSGTAASYSIGSINPSALPRFERYGGVGFVEFSELLINGRGGSEV